MSKVLVCLNSEQVIANVIALGETKPDRMVVISTEDMTGQFTNLSACARMMGLAPPERAILVPPWDFVAIAGVLAKQLPSAAFKDQQVVLNATGGTKPMAMVALEHFKEFPDFAAVYVDSRSGILYRFAPAPVSSQPLSFYAPVALYMRAYGFTAEAPSPLPAGEALSGFVERELPHVHGLIAKFKEAMRRGKAAEFTLPGIYGLTPRSKWRKLLDRLAEAGLISSFSWQESSRLLTVRTANPGITYQYFGQCGWLEYLIWGAAKRLCDEVHINVKVFRTPAATEGAVAEYDVVARIGGTLIFFECKAGSEIFESKQLGNLIQSLHSKAKLAGGAFARPVLVLGNKFRNPTEFQMERAGISGVEIITYDDLCGNLEKRLEEIFRPFSDPVWHNVPHR